MEFCEDSNVLEDTNELNIKTLDKDDDISVTDTSTTDTGSDEEAPRVRLFVSEDASKPLDSVDKKRYGLKESIQILENKMNSIEDSTQRSMMQKIINSAYEGKSELPKVMDIVEEVIIDTSKKVSDEPKKADIQTADITRPFTRRKVDFTALDEMYRQESLEFIERYRAENQVTFSYPKLIDENTVQEILSKPVHVATTGGVICHVDNYDLEPALDLPGDKILEDLNKNVAEDPLLSYDSMHCFDSELGDFVYDYSEEDIYTSADILAL